MFVNLHINYDLITLLLYKCNIFLILNSLTCHKPVAYIAVDEQLFPSKTRYPYLQDIASKSDNYGQKFWLAVVEDSKYKYNKCSPILWNRK